MSYQEKELSKDTLIKYLQVLDSDEGVRIEDNSEMIFINKTSKRYCVNISKNGHEEFLYMYNANEVFNFVMDNTKPPSKIFLY